MAIKEGVLYHRWELPELGKVTWQLVLPKGHRTSVLKQLHDNPVGGHLGVSKTLAEVCERFYWIHCRRDVEEWWLKSVKGSTGFIVAVMLKNGVKGVTSVLLEKTLG